MAITHALVADGDPLVVDTDWNANHVVTNIYGYTLVESKTIAEGSTTTTFSSLDGDTDVEYLIEFIGVMTHTSTTQLVVKPNNGTSNQSGIHFGFGDIGGANHNHGSTVSYLQLALCHTKQVMSYATAKLYAKTGNRRTMESNCLDVLTSTIQKYNYIGQWTDTSTNITSLVVAMNAGSFSGTLRLWKRITVS